MDGIANFFSPEAGQRRTQKLNAIGGQIGEAARYYLGPTGVPERAGAAANIAGMFSPGADMLDAASASGSMMRARTPMEAATAGAGMAGALGSMFIPGNAQRAGEALTRFGADEAGALKLPGFGDGRVYRSEALEYKNPNAGAVFYSPDPAYVQNYVAPDRVLREAQVPDGTLDIRDPATAQQVMEWVRGEADKARALFEDGRLSGAGPDLRDLSGVVGRSAPNDADVSRGLANIGLLRWRQGSPSVSGLAERELLDAFGAPAMTIRESDGSPSLAFRSPEIARQNWLTGPLPPDVAAMLSGTRR